MFFYFFIVYTTLIEQIVIVNGLTISFTPNSTVTIHIDDSIAVEYIITNVSDTEGNELYSFYLISYFVPVNKHICFTSCTYFRST